MKQISFFNTAIDDSAVSNVSKVLKSTFLSEGRMVQRFEQKLTNKLGIVNPIAVNSGTSALHLAYDLASIQEGDEVLCPAQTFVATALAILYQKAKPVFCDIQYETGNIDPSLMEERITEKTKAIVVVHWGGYPCDMDEINKIANKHKLIVIEDAAHALGAVYKKSIIGSISPITCFSFQAIKHLTTGDGGAVSYKDKSLYARGLSKRWFGIDRSASKQSILGERQYNISELGYKYHMNDFAAALGLANFKTLSKRLKKRRAIAKVYDRELSKVPGIRLFKYNSDRLSAYWLYGIHVEKRDDFINALKSSGIPTSVVHQRIDRNSIFGGTTQNLFNQERFDSTQIHIPVHDGLSDENINFIVRTIKRGW